MPTFTNNKGYAEPTINGDNNSWGGELNTNWSTLDLNLGGNTTVNVAGNANVTASAAQAQNLVQTLSGTLTGNIQYILPPVGGVYVINNITDGAFSITVLTSAGGSSGVVVQQGSQATVWSDGTNVKFASPPTGPLSGTTSIVLSGDATLTGAQAQNFRIAYSGALGANATLTFPNAGFYSVQNNLPDDTWGVVLAAPGGGTTVSAGAILHTRTALIYTDRTNVVLVAAAH